jgi:hypothetical protein
MKVKHYGTHKALDKRSALFSNFTQRIMVRKYHCSLPKIPKGCTLIYMAAEA